MVAKDTFYKEQVVFEIKYHHSYGIDYPVVLDIICNLANNYPALLSFQQQRAIIPRIDAPVRGIMRR